MYNYNKAFKLFTNCKNRLYQHTMNAKFARLILLKDKKPIRKIAVRQNLQGAITIGRQGYGNVIDLPGSYISRKHAEIVVENTNELWLRDMGSVGGCWVNGNRVHDYQLQHNDLVLFTQADNGYEMLIEIFAPKEQTFSATITGTANINTPKITENTNNNSQQLTNNSTGLTALNKDTSDIAELLKHKSEIIIGRSKNADIHIPQLTVTREHAKVSKNSNNEYFINDLGSRNGTFVNGERISKSTIITDEDEIFIGNYKFQLSQQAKDIRQHNAIVAQNLSRTVNNGKITILNDVSFKIPTKELVAIMGPSGSGKSTLLKALNGDFPASSGKVYIHGLDLYENYDYLKRMIGYVPQDDIVHKELSVERSLFYAAKLRLSSDVSNKDIRQKIDEVLTNLNINDPEIRKRKVGDLSGGQRKRVSIAVELLTDPSILFLDEPTSPLDPETIEDFLLCVQRLAKKGTTVLMVTHKPDDLYYINRVVFLSKGGYLTYYGSKENYLDFFGAENVIEVYSKNGSIQQGQEWAARLKDMYPNSGLIHQRNSELQKVRNESFFKQLFWLTARYFNIKTNDRSNTIILLLQAPIIAALVGLIFDNVELSVLFLMSISAIWFGTNNAAKEIVGELPIYRRERMFNLRIWPYVLSKILVLTFFSLIQIASFVVIVFAMVGTEELGMNNFNTQLGVMLYLSFSATLMGLLVSALVGNTEKVMTVIPIVLIPQIILSGVIAAIPEGNVVEYVSYAMLSRWGTEAFCYAQEEIQNYVPDPNPECIGEFIYQTVDAVEFLNLPNTFNLFEALSTNIWGISLLNLVVFIGILVALKRKDTV